MDTQSTSMNPVFNESSVRKFRAEDTNVMTLGGVIFKTTLLLAIVLTTAVYSWNKTSESFGELNSLLAWSSMIALVTALIIIFTRPNALLSMIYAAAQGVFLGSFSYLFSEDYQGIIVQAIGLTFAIFLSMLVLYATGLVKVTEKLMSGIYIATLGVLFFYLFEWILTIFNMDALSYTTSGSLGLAIGGIIVVIAALNLLLDFEFIERARSMRASKEYEWYSAFGLMVTLIWLYISILRLLAVSRN